VAGDEGDEVEAKVDDEESLAVLGCCEMREATIPRGGVASAEDVLVAALVVVAVVVAVVVVVLVVAGEAGVVAFVVDAGDGELGVDVLVGVDFLAAAACLGDAPT